MAEGEKQIAPVKKRGGLDAWLNCFDGRIVVVITWSLSRPRRIPMDEMAGIVMGLSRLFIHVNPGLQDVPPKWQRAGRVLRKRGKWVVHLIQIQRERFVRLRLCVDR